MKNRLLLSLHAKPEITSRIASRVVREGVPRFLEWTYESERKATLRFVENMRTGDYAYKFAASSRQSTLYGSIYGCLLLGMHGELDHLTESFKNGWLEYFDGFQNRADGLFRDPTLACPAYEGTPAWGDGWGARHLTAHIVIAYARLGRPPQKPFKFLESYYDTGYLNSWLGEFDFSANVWSQSNYIMNVFSLLQYSRDYMGEKRATPAVEEISRWLLARQHSNTGMWHSYQIGGYPEIGDAIRGAYHFYPLFVYEGKPIPYAESVIDTIMRSQNSWGGFNPEESPSGACEDIDAIEPLIRATAQTGYRQTEVENALRSAMIWVLTCRNRDGGYEYLPENGHHYGDHQLTTSRPGEGNLFATWFRSLCLAYLVNFLAISNAFTLGVYPGYEIALKQNICR